MAEEIKPDVNTEVKPAGEAPVITPAPNPTPSADELLKQKEELEKQLKEKDSKIADLETTRATIEARNRQIEEDRNKQVADADLKARITKINERRAYDPEGADAEMAALLTETKTQAAKDAVNQAQQIIGQQTAVEKLRLGVKSANPDFDDDIINVIMNQAELIARQGKAKTAEDAITQATNFVKSKFESYAQRKNAVPKLPDGARAEGGGANNLPQKPEPDKELSPADEITEQNAAKQRKLI